MSAPAPAGMDSESSGAGNTNGPAGSGVSNCSADAHPDPTALETMLECVGRWSQVTNPLAALVDIDKKLMFIVDRKSGKVVRCASVSTGYGGRGANQGQTPAGCMITGPHHGTYDSTANGTNKDCVGLFGTDAETKARTDRGVILHKAKGCEGMDCTAGCIGVQDDMFDQIKQDLYGSDSAPLKSAVCAFDSQTREKCLLGEGAPNNASGGSRPTTGGSSPRSTSTPATK